MRNACFWFSSPSILASKINSKTMFFQDTFLVTSFKIYIDFMRNLSIWRPLQNPVGVKMGHKINQVAPKTFIVYLYGSTFFPVRETRKHVETSRGLDLRFVYVLHCFTFSNFSDTVITKYMICFIFVIAPNPSRNA